MTGLIRAGLAHGKVMAAIHAAAFPVGERWGPDAMTLQLGLPGAFGYLAGPDGLVLARVAADEAEILTLAVVPERRRSGLGAALLTAASRHAAEAGAVALLLEVATENLPALALYVSHGFQKVGLRRGYYAGGADALVLRRELGTKS